MLTGAGVASNAMGNGCMQVGSEPGGPGMADMGGAGWGGTCGCCCGWAFTALATSSSQRSASDGVRLWPLATAGGDCSTCSGCTHELAAVGEPREEGSEKERNMR